MGERTMAAGLPSYDGLVDAVRDEAARHADRWFPDLDAGSVRTVIRPRTTRPRCLLYDVELDDGRVTQTAVLKVRHSVPTLRRVDRYDSRPVLEPQRTLSDAETAEREYHGLREIEEAFAHTDLRRFGVLRAFAWLPEHAAILMERAEHPTLRQRLLATSRTTLRPRPGIDEGSWTNAGAWLHRFQARQPPRDLPARLETRHEVAERYQAYAEFLLQHRVSATFLTRLTARAPDLAAAHLPERLPMAAGHGDFVDSNMFASPEGRITVFDPLSVWRVPVYQDLATFLVGFRTLPVQATSQGLALARDDLERYERAVLRGYFGSDVVPHGAVRAFTLLVLLDRWATMVSKRARHRGMRSQLHDVRMRVAAKHIERETGRLVAALERS